MRIMVMAVVPLLLSAVFWKWGWQGEIEFFPSSFLSSPPSPPPTFLEKKGHQRRMRQFRLDVHAMTSKDFFFFGGVERSKSFFFLLKKGTQELCFCKKNFLFFYVS